MLNAEYMFIAIVLAAGKGTRMKSELPKVLHPLAGTPMICHVLKSAYDAGAERALAIVGHGAEAVQSKIAETFPQTETVMQAKQLGTAHAVQQCQSALEGVRGTAVILTGDCPLVEPQHIDALLHTHHTYRNAISFISTVVEDPTGLGRVIRNRDGSVQRIVEHKDATPDELAVKEINTGIYAVELPLLFELLAEVKNNNANNEYYLPDIIPAALNRQKQELVGACTVDDGEVLLGINTPEQLQQAEELFATRAQQQVMESATSPLGLI